jgi:hypothetical protein
MDFENELKIANGIIESRKKVKRTKAQNAAHQKAWRARQKAAKEFTRAADEYAQTNNTIRWNEVSPGIDAETIEQRLLTLRLIARAARLSDVGSQTFNEFQTRVLNAICSEVEGGLDILNLNLNTQALDEKYVTFTPGATKVSMVELWSETKDIVFGNLAPLPSLEGPEQIKVAVAPVTRNENQEGEWFDRPTESGAPLWTVDAKAYQARAAHQRNEALDRSYDAAVKKKAEYQDGLHAMFPSFAFSPEPLKQQMLKLYDESRSQK